MTTLTIKAIVQENGKIELNNLPFSVGKELEITISEKVETKLTEEEILEKLEKLRKGAGTIKNTPGIPLEALRRENMYGDDGR
ncbi:MAG: hypothetical protein MUE85_17335 [Microscillaceae bacterium]|jgi:hypothetical protein|nr:hypothetical protein [Microscillaceae bacterium]